MFTRLLPFIFFFPISTFAQQLQPGNLHPDVKVLKGYGRMSFNYGLAVIAFQRTGNTITSSGKIFDPFRVMIMRDISNGTRQEFSKLGFFEGRNSEHPNGAIYNYKGKLIYHPPLGGDYQILYTASSNPDYLGVLERQFNKKGAAIIATKLIARDGKIITFANQKISYYNEGVAAFRGFNGLFGFMDTTGNVIIHPKYLQTRGFFEGRAAVAKNLEEGPRWGFIDKVDSVIVPFSFFYPPGDFSEGLAYVQHGQRSISNVEFIDRAGNPVFSFPETILRAQDVLFKNFSNGILCLYGKDSLLLKNGQFLSSSKFLSTYDVPQEYKLNIRNWGEGEILLEGSNKRRGLLVIREKFWIPPVFVSIGHYDPISKLTFAIFKTDDNHYRHGYIDRYGVFKILIDENE